MPFSRSAVILLFTTAVTLFALSVLLRAYDLRPSSTQARSNPSSYSTSALGHAGLYEMLRTIGRPVQRSVGHTAAQVGNRGTHLVIEPSFFSMPREEWQALMRSPQLLLVLPKWRGVPDIGKLSWISEAKLRTLNNVDITLAQAVSDASVLRTDLPAQWTENIFTTRPTIPEAAGQIQLIRNTGTDAPALRPLVATEDGILLGELATGAAASTIWILADPDILSNHGLLVGDNAAFITEVLDTLRSRHTDDPGPIVFDETIHGFREAEGSPVKLLFAFPMVVVVLLVCAAAALAVLAGAGRFGAPQHPAQAASFGKKGLIDNSARLLDYTGHHAFVLRRFIAATIRSTARALHMPPGLDEREVVAKLDAVAKARGVEGSCRELVYTVAGLDAGNPEQLNRLFESARDIHRWKGELLHGPGTQQQR